MPTDLERLVVSLEARISSYEREMKKANALTRTTMRDIGRNTTSEIGRIEGRLQGFAGSVNGVVARISSSFRGLSAGLAGVAGILGGSVLVQQTRQALNWADALQDTSTRLQINVETLQAWQLAAETSGSSANALESALDKLTVKIGDAVEGDKEAVASFDGLGVSLIDAAGNVRSTEDVFRQLIDALSKIPDLARRYAAETDLMGRGAMELDALIREGTEALDENTRSLREQGAILAGETVKSAAAAADAMVILGAAITANLNGALNELGPLLIWATGLLKDFIVEAREFFEITPTEADVAARLLGVPRADGRTPTDRLLGVPSPLSDEVALNLQSLRFAFAPPGSQPSAPRPGTRPEAPAAEAESRGRAARAAREQVSALAELMTALQQEAELSRLSDRERRLREELIRAEAAALRDFNAGLRESAALTQADTDAIRANVEAMDDFKDAESRFLEGTKEFDKTAQDASDSTLELAEALGGVFDGAISGAEDFNDALDTILLKLLEIAAQAAFGQGPAGGLFNQLLGVGGGGLLGLLGGGATKTAGGGGTIKGFAGGGAFSAGQLAMVGEGGPELVRFGRPGMVVPAEATRRALSGGDRSGPIQVVVTGATGNAEVQRMISAGMDQAFRRAVAASPAAVASYQLRYG